MLSKNIALNTFLAFFLIGVFTNNIISNLQSSIKVALLGVLLFLNFKIYYRFKFILIVLLFIGYVFGAFISDKNIYKVANNNSFLEYYYDKNKHDLSLEILGVNKIEDFSVEYIARLISIDNEFPKKNIKMILSVPINFKLKKGYIISSESKLYKIKPFNGFSYDKYMLSKGIYFKSFFSSYYILEKKDLHSLIVFIDILREKLLEVIYKLYPRDEAIFLGGILLGARESLSDDLKEDFNNSGLTHFIAVSGFNITILVIFFSFLFKFFPVFFRIILITLVIILFTLLVGDTAPVVRASIMGLLGYYILSSGRKADMMTIVLLTAFLMVLFSPFILNWDVSFALSFLAVLGIFYTQDFFKKVFFFFPETLAIKEAFVLTMSATVFALPIMLFNFGQIPLISPLSNVAMAWTIPIAMLFGFLSIIFYLLYEPLGYIFGYLDYVFLHYDMIIVRFFGNMEYMLLKFDAGIYKNYFMILYFMFLAFLIIYFKKEKK